MSPAPDVTLEVAQDTQPTAAKDTDPPAVRLRKYRNNIASLNEDKAARCRKAWRKLHKAHIRLYAQKPTKSKEFKKSRRREAFEARLNAMRPSPLRRQVDLTADTPSVRVVRLRLRLPKGPSTVASGAPLQALQAAAATPSPPTTVSGPPTTHPPAATSQPPTHPTAPDGSATDAPRARVSGDSSPSDADEEPPRTVLVEGNESRGAPLRSALWVSFWLSVEAAAGVPRDKLDTWNAVLDVICTARKTERPIALRLYNRPPAVDSSPVLAIAGLPKATSPAQEDVRVPLEPLNGCKRSRSDEDEELEAPPAKRTATMASKLAISSPGFPLKESDTQVGRRVQHSNTIIPSAHAHAPSNTTSGHSGKNEPDQDGDSMQCNPMSSSGDGVRTN